MYPLGQQATITACPQCSYLWEGKCIMCVEGDPHPACINCVDGRPAKAPWYKSELFIAIAAGVTISVVSTLIVARIERKLRR